MASPNNRSNRPAPAPTTAIATYRGLSAAALDTASSMANGGDRIKLKAGENRLRATPSVGKWEAIVGVTQHYVEISSDQKFAVNCPAKMARRPCPICQACDKMALSQNPLDQERAEKWKGKGRYFINAILRGEENQGPRVFDFGWQIKDWLDKQFKADGDWTDPTAKGYDFIVIKSGEGMSTKYSCTVKRDCYNVPLGTPAQMKEWLTLDALVDLDTKSMVLAYDDIVAKMNPPEASGYDARRQGVQGSTGRLDNGHTIDAQGDGDPGPSDEDEDGV